MRRKLFYFALLAMLLSFASPALAQVAKIGEQGYATLNEAFAAATEGQTITLLADATPALTSQRAITKAAIIDLDGKTLNLTEDDLYFGTTTFKNGTIVVDPSVKPSTAVFWMFANQTLTFDNVKIVATGVTGTYLIGLDGNNSDLNLLNGSEIVVENTSALDLDIICVNASTGNDIKVENSKVNVTNLDGRVFFRGNYTVKDSEVNLAGITKAGFRIEAGQTLSIEGTSKVNIEGAPRDGGIHLTDLTATYTKAETATVNATVNEPKVAKVGENTYKTLALAVAAAQNGETITLIDNVVLAERVTIPADKTLTIDLNGKSISMEESIIATAYAINNLGNLTITDGVGGGSINARGIYNGYGDGAANVATAKITVVNGTINAKGTNGGAAIFNYGVADIQGGNFTSIGGYSLNNQKGASMTIADGVTANNGIYASGTTLVVNGGEINGNRSGCHVLYAWNSAVTINGGTFHNNNSGNSTTMAGGTTKLTINGGTFSIANGKSTNGWTSCLIDATDGGKYEINGGEFKGHFRVQANCAMEINGGTFENTHGEAYVNGGTVAVKGGTFTDAAAQKFATDNLADGYELGANGTVAAKPAVLAGEGTEANPYLISSIDDLILFRNSVNEGVANKYNAPGVWVALGADIDLAGENWVGIGSAYKDHGFMGNFDGKNFKIKNLTIENPALDSDGYAYAALFGVTEGTDQNNQNVIKNLTIENVKISTSGHIVSAAIAYPYCTIVDNVTVCGNIDITGGDYTAGALAYTRRCLNASNVKVAGAEGSTITGASVVGGVISDIQMNGGLKAEYSNFSVSGVSISGTQMVGGISGIICLQTLNGASVNDVTLTSGDNRVGIVSGSWGDVSTIINASYDNVEGATAIVGPTYKGANPVEAKIGDTYYATFAAAYEVAQSGDKITLLTDIESSEIIVLDKSITLDGNGKTLTSTAARAINVTGADGVTIKNLNIVASGERAFNIIQKATNVTIENVTASSANYTVNIASSAPNAVVAIKNSTLDGLCTVNVSAEGAKVTVDNSTVNCNDKNTTAGESYAALSLNKEAIGGSIVATNTTVNVAEGSDSYKGRNAAENGIVTINGSTEDVLVNVAVITYEDSPYYYGFASVAKAVEFAKEGDVITLIRDITIAEPVTITKSITLDGNNKTLTYSGSNRAIEMPSTDDADLNVTIKNLKVAFSSSYSQRGINYNDNGTLTLENVTVNAEGKNVTYALNLPGSSDNTTVTIKNSSLTGNIALNVWGENMTINAEASNFTSIDKNEVENYCAIALNNDGSTYANGTIVTINGGSITANDENGKPSYAVRNATATGKVNVSETTTVIGTVANPAVAIVTYEGYSEFYSLSTLQKAIDKAIETKGAVKLIADVTASEIITVNAPVVIDGNGKTLTSTAARAINVTGADGVTIKNLTINASGERAINIIQKATNVTIDNVTATAANYTVNVAASAGAAKVNVSGSILTGLNTVNIAGAGAEVTIDNSSINTVDNNETEGYSSICLNKDAKGGKIVVTNSTINISGTHPNETYKAINQAENGTITIDGSTEDVTIDVAYISYGNNWYGFTTIKAAIEKAEAGETVILLRDITLSELVKVEKAIAIDLNGKTVTANCKKAFEVYANATIKNGTIIGQNRCVDTRKAVELTLTDVKLVADNHTSAYGNPQPLTIGGSENGTKVVMTNSNISAKAGYGIITFVKTDATITGSTISGYSALYIKPGSDNSTFAFVDTDLTGSTASNDVEGNSFSTIAVRANNVNITADAASTITAEGNYCHALSLGGTYEGEKNTEGNTVTIAGTITGNIISSSSIEKNTVNIPAQYANALCAAGYVIRTNEDGSVSPVGLSSIKNEVEVEEGTSEEEKEVIEETVADIVTNDAVSEYEVELPEEVESFEITLTAVATTTEETEGGEGEGGETTTTIVPTKITFNVSPISESGDKVSAPTKAITFRLPLPANWASEMVKVFHEGNLIGTYPVLVSESGAKYIEVSSMSFSEFVVEAVNASSSEEDVIESMTIADGSVSEFVNSTNLTVGTLTYTRTLKYANIWNALYVPFEIPVTETFLENYDVAYFNDIHSYDDNNDGEIDRMEMEVLHVQEGQVLNANYPYLIRAKNEKALNMNIVLTDATLYSAVENTISCSSVFMRFEVSGIYSSKTAGELKGDGEFDVYALGASKGTWSPAADANATLNPFRIYLSMSTISGSPVKVSAAALRSISIKDLNEDDANITDDQTENIDVIYDLLGRRVMEPQKGVLYIMNGKKVVF